MQPLIDGASVSCGVPDSPMMNVFAREYDKILCGLLSSEEMMVCQLLMVSQFVRMLPYKTAIDEDQAILFYSLASSLYADMRSRELSVGED